MMTLTLMSHLDFGLMPTNICFQTFSRFALTPLNVG